MEGDRGSWLTEAQRKQQPCTKRSRDCTGCAEGGHERTARRENGERRDLPNKQRQRYRNDARGRAEPFVRVLRKSTPKLTRRSIHAAGDRKITRLNSSHANISYAVF